jgi:hypothetical protein
VIKEIDFEIRPMVTSGTSALGVTDHLNVEVNVIFASVILKAGAFLMSYLQSVAKEVSFFCHLLLYRV